MINKLYPLISCFVMIWFTSNGQQYDGKSARDIFAGAKMISYANPTKAPSLVMFEEGTITEQNFFSEMRTSFHMQFADSWKKVRTDKDELQMQHHRYQQYYNGIAVEQGEYILHEKSNFLVSANGVFFDGLSLQVIPAVKESDALKAALTEVNAKKYKWEMPNEEKLLKEMENNNQATYFPQGQLVISRVNADSKIPVLKLAYKFDVYADEPMSRQFVYVDAMTCKVLKKEDRICGFIANGTLNTKYAGTKNLITDSVSPGNYRLRDISRGGNVETYNMNSGTDYGLAVDFTDADNIWNTVANQDNAAYDAHYGAQMTYDYYLTVHNRNSYDNLGSPLRSYVHFFSNYNNAFWNVDRMSYGDGNGVLYSALTALDICGHELTHGITNKTSGLVFSFESGALNESFSDIFATCVDFFANPGGANFQIGEQCYTPGTPGDALRYLNNPNLASNPDTYQGTFWYTGVADNGGVHTNSGVQNFWFYLLCQGGSGTNDIAFNYNVSGIGINDARLIAYRNNCFYLTSGAQYADARTYSILAAGDLFGPCSAQQLAVKNAWDAVGVTGVFNTLPGVNAGNTSPVCPGVNLNLSSSGGVSYSWSGPGGFSSSQQNPNISSITGAQGGTYIVTASNGNGCTTSRTTFVEVHPQPVVTVSPPVNICLGNSTNLTSSATASGIGGPPVSNTSTTVFAIPDNNPTGVTSTITVSNNGNANKVLSVTIDSLIHTWVGDLKFYLIAPNNSQIVLASAVGGSGDNFLHTVFSSSANNIIGAGADTLSPFNGTYAPQTPFSDLTGVATGQWKLKIVDNIQNDVGTLYKWTVTLSGPNGISSYSWSPSTGLNSTSVQNPISSPLSTTTYSVTATDFKGCTVSATTAVNLNPAVLSDLTASISCNGLTDGSINLSVSGGNGPFSYLWSNGNTNEDLSALASGTYTVTVTDALGCTKTRTSVISQPSAVSSTAVALNPLCFNSNNGSINLSLTGGVPSYSFLWSTGSTNMNISGLAGGSYSVTITDANGCIKTNSYVLTQPTDVAVSSSSTNVLCNGNANGALNITVNGGTSPYNFNWSNGSTTEDLTSISAGTYSVTVTDLTGCTKTYSIAISQPPALLPLVSSQNPSCFNSYNGQITLSVSGGTPGYTYAWSNGATSKDISGLSGGIFSVSITDGNGCTTSTSTLITDPVLLSSNSTLINPLCFGNSNGSVNITVNGGTSPYSFAWSNGSTTKDITGIGAGTYNLIITDANGCVANSSNILVSPAIIGITGSSIPVSCYGLTNGSIDISITGGSSPYNYNWSNGSTSQDINSLGAGPYQVTLSDLNGCTATKLFTISQPAIISLSSVNTNPSCSQVFGQIDLSVSGGAPGFSFLWSNGATTEDLNLINSGTYSVTVTDLNGCVGTYQTTLTGSVALSVTSTPLNVSCFGSNNGSIQLTPSGGILPYTFNWSDGNTNQNRGSLAPGGYTVTISDNGACSTVLSFSITQPAVLTLSTIKTDISCKNGSDGSIDLTPAGGTAPFAYLWSNGASTQDLVNLVKANYTVTVTDSRGCGATIVAILSQPATSLSANTSQTNVRCFGSLTGMATVTGTGGTPPYTYLWNTAPPSSISSVTGLGAGSYSCLVSDAKGCTKNVIVNITQPSQIIILITKTNVTTNGGSDGTATASATGGVGPYNYSWNTVPVKTSSTITGLSAGVYSVKVTDSKNCAKTAVVSITQPLTRFSGNQPFHINDNFQLKVFPNPSDGLLNIEFDGLIKDKGNVFLIDITGRMVFENEVSINEGLNQFVYDFSGFTKGLYLLVYKSSTGEKRIRVVLE